MLKDNLRKAIKTSGLYVKEVSARSNVPKRTIDKWLEVEDINPRAMDLFKVARVLDKTVEELLTGAVPEGVSAAALELSGKIEKLPAGDRQELEAIIDIKLSRIKGGLNVSPTFSGRRKRE
ncbi:MAG: helix-turn-helix transcriptional regulator [Treponema sp.]|jgi:transcriptional regulator with XRE-family HTH domain|nr:helix-turn-helix transcriptional regulator [Treponema sp.]